MEDRRIEGDNEVHTAACRGDLEELKVGYAFDLEKKIDKFFR